MGFFDDLKNRTQSLFQKFTSALTPAAPAKPPVYGPTKPAAPSAPAPTTGWRQYIAPLANAIDVVAKPGGLSTLAANTINKQVVQPAINKVVETAKVAAPIATAITRSAVKETNQNASAGGRLLEGLGNAVNDFGKNTVVPAIQSLPGQALDLGKRVINQPITTTIQQRNDAVLGGIAKGAKILQEDVLQPGTRIGVSLVSGPAKDAGLIKDSTVTPVSPLAQFFLGKEPIKPLAENFSDIQKTEKALGFSPFFAGISAPLLGLGSAYLDVLPGVDDIITKGAKDLIKFGVKDVVADALKHEAADLAERGTKEAVDEFVQRGVAEVEQKAGRALTETETRSVEDALRHGVSELSDPVKREAARTVAEKVAAPAVRTIAEVTQDIEKKLGRSVSPAEAKEIETRVAASAPKVAATAPVVSPPAKRVPVVAPIQEVAPVVENATKPIKKGGRLVFETPVTPAAEDAATKAAENIAPDISKGTKEAQVSDGYGSKDVLTSPFKEAQPPVNPTAVVAPAEQIAKQGEQSAAGVTPSGEIKSSPSPVLDEVEKIFKAPVGEKKGIIEKGKDFLSNVRTSVENQFYPIQRREAMLRKEAGSTLPEFHAARQMEFQAGAQGKAEVDLMKFDNDVVKPIAEHFDDFEKYLFLKRTEDRLLKETETGSSRAVGSFTVEKARAGLAELQAKLGPEVFQRFEQTGATYQKVMDDALRLQVESGRMSQELYDAIKKQNDFYAPFHVLQHLDEVEHLAGSGKAIPGAAEFTKRITGIGTDEFNLGGILQTSADQVFKSRIMAEKTLRMRAIDGLADLDPEGKFFKRVAANGAEKTKPGFEVIHYFKDGKRMAMEVEKDVAKALGQMSPAEIGLTQKVLSLGAKPLRIGATTANVAFQPVNALFADLPAAALLSKYGIKGPIDALRFPLDWMQGFFSSLRSNFGSPDQLFKDWMASGAANTSIQRSLTPEAFKRSLSIPEKTVAGRTAATARKLSPITNFAKFANAIEEGTKLTGFKRGLRFEGLNMREIEKLSPVKQQEALQSLVSEVRNYAGSPDFSRSGSMKNLNLLFMFFNARTQGAVRGLKRLSGVAGGKEALGAWTRYSSVIGVPTTALMLYNMSPEHRDDYMAIPQYERDNYFMIPNGKTFVDDSTGQTVRDYWRIPKREEVKLFANMIESGIMSATTHASDAVMNFAQSFLENISPINIEGNGAAERAQSVVGSLNPLLKVPLEQTFNTDTFRKAPIVSDKYSSPDDRTLEFTATTPEELKSLAGYGASIFGKDSVFASPLRLGSMIQGLTAGGVTQFMGKNPEEGRGDYTTYPLISRFVRGGTVNRDAFWDLVSQASNEKQTGQVETRQAVDQAITDLSSGKMTKQQFLQSILDKTKEDPGYADRVKEALWEKSVGYTSEDKALKNFGIEDGSRAQLISQILASQYDTPEKKKAYLKALVQKKIVTADVLKQILQLQNTTP